MFTVSYYKNLLQYTYNKHPWPKYWIKKFLSNWFFKNLHLRTVDFNGQDKHTLQSSTLKKQDYVFHLWLVSVSPPTPFWSVGRPFPRLFPFYWKCFWEKENSRKSIFEIIHMQIKINNRSHQYIQTFPGSGQVIEDGLSNWYNGLFSDYQETENN